jgi:hypothetical protein
MNQPTRENVLPFKDMVDQALHELGEPPLSLAEAMIGIGRAAEALAISTKERRAARGAEKGLFAVLPRPKLRVV